MTLLTTLLDFADTGILDIFVDEASVRLREMTIGAQAPHGPALLKGKELATTFSFLRPNDLVWNYVVGNYLKGETPPPFDLLYWNGDSTNLPGPMYCWYLRNTYLENRLKVPGALTVCGEMVDLGRIQAPVFVYASREDHIVPWTAAYASIPLLEGKRKFVLGASGHIAGVINPPAKGKRSHWIGTTNALPADAQDWFAKAKLQQEGSYEHDPKLNYFKVNASQPLSEWRRKGWIYKDDPRGWFQWYCRYYMGRRCPDDARQIKRWRAFARHAAQVRNSCKPGDFGCHAKQRQALLHWAYDSRKI